MEAVLARRRPRRDPPARQARPDDADWAAVAYLWSGLDAVAAPLGYIDALDTPHDIPAAGECIGCHGGRRSFALGVSAIQLAPAAAPGDFGLAELAAAGRLTTPLPTLALPGDDLAHRALGFLHANCGHCHSAAKLAAKPCLSPANDLDFWLRADRLASVEDTPAYTSAVGVAIEPGAPSASLLIERLSTRDLFTRMPPLATTSVDPDALAVLTRWIQAL